MNVTFKQDTRLSRDTLILEESRLVISTDVGSLHDKKAIRLSDFSPEPRRYQKRFAHLIFVPVLLGMGMWWAADALLRQQEVDHVVVIAPIIGMVVVLWYVIEGLRGIPAVQFFDKSGRVLVEVFGPKGKTLACDEFATALSDSIKAGHAEKGEPIQRATDNGGAAPRRV